MQILKMKISLISNPAYTEANVVTSLQIKKAKNTFIVCIRSQNVQKDETLCYNKKHKKLIAIIGWLGCNEWTWKR